MVLVGGGGDGDYGGCKVDRNVGGGCSGYTADFSLSLSVSLPPPPPPPLSLCLNVAVDKIVPADPCLRYAQYRERLA